ncbi:MAG TPA: hypothetical protein VE669_07420 [Actinomycetota bacterium]|jgi:hypothetical protein|nr:hypothetical protein [Actinomycetota bacterium]
MGNDPAGKDPTSDFDEDEFRRHVADLVDLFAWTWATTSAAEPVPDGGR